MVTHESRARRSCSWRRRADEAYFLTPSFQGADHRRERERYVAIHDVAEHTSDGQALRILLGNEPPDPFHNVLCRQRPWQAITYDVEPLALVRQIMRASPVKEHRHVYYTLAVRGAIGAMSEWMELEFDLS